jgi:hypothetical protein
LFMQWDLWDSNWMKFSDWDSSSQMQIFNQIKDEFAKHNNNPR